MELYRCEEDRFDGPCLGVTKELARMALSLFRLWRENEVQSILVVFQQALRWDAVAAGISHLMVVVMGR